MKYLVTGGGGYVGRYVVKHLVQEGHDVTVTVRGSRPESEQVTFVKMDVLDSGPDIYNETGRPDICIHLAWEQGFVHGSPLHIDNVGRHVRFMQNMLAGGLPHLVGIGTMHEIGYHVGPVTEGTPTNPVHAYGIAKNYLQRVQTILCREHNAVSQWLRCFYIIGDDRRNSSIFRKMLDAVDEGNKSFPLNSGEMLFDFLEVDELGWQIAKVSSQTEVTDIVNCCSGTPTSLRTKVLQFIEDNKLNLTPQWGTFPLRPHESLAIWGDRRKLDLALAAAMKSS